MPNTRRLVVPAGTIVFHEGKPGDTAYILEYGRVAVYKTVKGKRIDIGEVGQGGIFGEMALIDDHPRMASAIALEESACVIVRKQRLTEQLEQAPEGVRLMVGALLGNIRLMGAELAEVSVILSHEKP